MWQFAFSSVKSSRPNVAISFFPCERWPAKCGNLPAPLKKVAGQMWQFAFSSVKGSQPNVAICFFPVEGGRPNVAICCSHVDARRKNAICFCARPKIAICSRPKMAIWIFPLKSKLPILAGPAAKCGKMLRNWFGKMLFWWTAKRNGLANCFCGWGRKKKVWQIAFFGGPQKMDWQIAFLVDRKNGLANCVFGGPQKMDWQNAFPRGPPDNWIGRMLSPVGRPKIDLAIPVWGSLDSVDRFCKLLFQNANSFLCISYTVGNGPEVFKTYTNVAHGRKYGGGRQTVRHILGASKPTKEQSAW